MKMRMLKLCLIAALPFAVYAANNDMLEDKSYVIRITSASADNKMVPFSLSYASRDSAKNTSLNHITLLTPFEVSLSGHFVSFIAEVMKQYPMIDVRVFEKNNGKETAHSAGTGHLIVGQNEGDKDSLVAFN